MKRIEFIAPVEAVRGNLSGRQDLQYAENDNPAYDSPLGRVNYARNYSPRFIGAKRAADGRKYFQVRTKTATHMTTKAKKAMAVMGGTGAIVAAILRDKTSQLYASIYANFVNYSEMVETISFRKYLTKFIMGRVRDGIEIIVFTSPTGSPAQIRNPWYDGSQTEGIEVSDEILVKFWGQLAPLAVEFTVNGDKGVAKSSWGFDDLIQVHQDVNFLGLALHEVDGQNYVVREGLYLLNNGEYVKSGDTPESVNYTLTINAPQE